MSVQEAEPPRVDDLDESLDGSRIQSIPITTSIRRQSFGTLAPIAMDSGQIGEAVGRLPEGIRDRYLIRSHELWVGGMERIQADRQAYSEAIAD